MEILRIENLSFTYATGEIPALCGVSLTIQTGDFFLLCGASGSGKTTLLRFCKPELRPHGTVTGHVTGTEGEIGFVLQNPEAQLVSDKVWHELAFGLENQGIPTGEIRRRVAETASFFGIQHLFRERTANLSGGQKQLVNLAAVMAMNPKILILDEPTAQLDPVATYSFLQALGRVNRELGVTILLAEHNWEEPFALANAGAVMDNGTIISRGTPAELARNITVHHPKLHPALPAAAQMAADCQEETLPITVGEGRRWLEKLLTEKAYRPNMKETPPERSAGLVLLEAKDVWFGHQKGVEPTIRGLSLTVEEGDFLALLGGNGSGKTTLLRLLSGGSTPQRGRVRMCGKIITRKQLPRGMAVLPQNPQALFVQETLGRDLQDALLHIPQQEREERVYAMAEVMEITHLLGRHPYDLSGGEMQRGALAKILLCQPHILLLDEPTKGLDALAKRQLGRLLEQLRTQGMTILLVSHDVEFCALFARRCALLFDGTVVSIDKTRQFFSGNRYYTTAAQRITAGLLGGILTSEEGAAACRKIRNSD